MDRWREGGRDGWAGIRGMDGWDWKDRWTDGGMKWDWRDGWMELER